MIVNQQQLISSTWPAYRNNFARHLLGVNTFIQTDVMEALQARNEHARLKLSYEPYVSLLALKTMSLSPIAASLGISKQAANKTASQLEAEGYIRRTEATEDKRSKLLALTSRGRSLVQTGLEAYQVTEDKLIAAAPDCELEALRNTLSIVTEKLDLVPVALNKQAGTLPFASLLARLSDYINARLMALTEAQGHPRLKLSYAHILSNIGPRGVRMQDIARVRKISKQAVSTIARELEGLGYIHREADNGSARQQRLHFTQRGVQLISDSVNSVRQLEQELSQQTGSPRFDQLKKSMAAIYEGLELGRIEFGHLQESELHKKAQSLIRELGQDQARDLAHILLTP